MPAESHIDRVRRGRTCDSSRGEQMCDLAGRQHGVVARRQLRGARGDAVTRSTAGSPRAAPPVHRGVFARRPPHCSLPRAGGWLRCSLAGRARRSVGARPRTIWGLRGLLGQARGAGPATAGRADGGSSSSVALAPDEITARGRHPDHHGRPNPARPGVRPRLATRLAQAIGAAETAPPRGLSLIARPDRAPPRSARPRARCERSSPIAASASTCSPSELEIEFAAFVTASRPPAPGGNAWVEVDGSVIRPSTASGVRRGLAVELDRREHHADWRLVRSPTAPATRRCSRRPADDRVTARRHTAPARLKRPIPGRHSTALSSANVPALSGSGFGRSRGAGSRSCPRRSG